MARGTGTIAAPTAGRSTADESSPPPADVLVVFGITGDLAKVMTFERVSSTASTSPTRASFRASAP